MGRYRWLIFLFCLLLTVPFPCSAAETEPAETSETLPEELPQGPGLYFGLLHSHSSLSDGTEPAEAVFRRAAGERLDFFALTDHSDSFSNPVSLSDGTGSPEWTAGKAAAEAATDSDFVAIFGFEMSWGNGLGHIGTFCTPGFVSWRQEEFSTFRTGLSNYYTALSALPEAIGQFNHPDNYYGLFQDFDYRTEAADRQMALLEVGSPDGIGGYRYYDRALDKGWHVAPVNNDPTCRTVVYAQSLTEAGICDALRSRRVYATEDADLSVHYSMEGQLLGSRLKQWQLGDSADILVTLSDPTDAIGKVEVIGEKGVSLASRNFDSPWATAEFSLPGDQRYYYIKVTQPDGDVAVTAPVWVEQTEYAGIRSLTSNTELPLSGQTAELSLELYNQESALLTVQKIDIHVDGTLYHTLTEPASLWQVSTVLSIPLTLRDPGKHHIAVTVTAGLGGALRQYSAELSLTLRLPETVTSLLVDGTHGNTESYAQLAALAVENNIAVHRETQSITPETLKNTSIFLIPGPETAFSEEFIAMVRDYMGYGGTVLFTGGNAESNRLLEALGSSIRFGEDDGQIRYLADFNPESPLCANVQNNQLYCCSGSVTAAPEHWVVENVLAQEGNILAGCGSWLSDEALAEPVNLWDLPAANRTVAETLLGSTGVSHTLTAIRDLRTGAEGQMYVIRGYVTANRFADTVYLQDDSGGIAVVDFGEDKPPMGTALEIQGILTQQHKNAVLKLISCRVLEADPYWYLPEAGEFSDLMNNARHGGDLVQVEGEVVSMVSDENGAIRELVLAQNGQYAAVFIDDGIVSRSLGYNDLLERAETGKIFRAIGLVYMREDGVSVVRVHDCDEVVHVPVIRYYWEPSVPDNPRVGDSIGFRLLSLLLSAAFLCIIRLCKPHCK